MTMVTTSTIDLYKYEKELWESGIKLVAGVDEVGRGPLVGPVVAAAVILPKSFVLEGLTDSKKLSEKKRNLFYKIIMKEAISVGIGIIDAFVIDEVNIYAASKLAMYEAISKLSVRPEHVLIDAMPLDLEVSSTSIIRGDSLSISVAAASVVAKVTRDEMMYELDRMHPDYGFKNHKGYPTKAHLKAIDECGILPNYRMTYAPVKKILMKKQ